jgi:uncharacterized protein DUF4440
MARKESHTMKHPRITRLIAMFAATAAVAAAAVAVAVAAAPSRTAGAAKNPAAKIRATERALLNAAVDADTHTAGKLLAPEFQLIDVLGGPETRADYLANIGGQIDFVTLKPVSRITVRTYGNTAVARLHLAFEVIARGDTLKHQGWTTDVLERRRGHWQVVWSQTTGTPNDPALLIQALKPQS